MKKILVITFMVTSASLIKAQSKAVHDTIVYDTVKETKIYDTINDMTITTTSVPAYNDLKNYETVVDNANGLEDFNILVYKGRLENLEYADYVGLTDTAAQNTFRKIGGNYEINVNNLGKPIVITKGLESNAMITAQSGTGTLIPLQLNNVNFLVGNQMKKYACFFYNMSFDKLFVVHDSAHGGQAIQVLFNFKYPKPRIAYVSFTDSLINQKRQDPSKSFYSLFVDEHPIRIQKDQSEFLHFFSQKQNSILFVFDHFLRFERALDNDQLQYKLDNQTDWSMTALSLTPSILLENLSLGKHTLYVKYPAKDADILEYHFAIAPN